MHTPLAALVCILLTVIQTASFFVSAVSFGYDCDDLFIPGKKLDQVVRDVYMTYWFKFMQPLHRKKFMNNYYNGPPFTQPYLLWPVSPITKNYDEAASTPYRVVLDRSFKVFSVVMKNEEGIKECKMREKLVTNDHSPYAYECWGGNFEREDLIGAASAACPKIQRTSTEIFPARYDGSPFRRSERQLYVFPVLNDRIYEQGLDPGSYYAVINSTCKVVGVVKRSETSKYVKCRCVLSHNSMKYRRRK